MGCDYIIEEDGDLFLTLYDHISGEMLDSIKVTVKKGQRLDLSITGVSIFCR